MPTLHAQLTPEGAVVDVLIGVSNPRAQALQAAGQAIPPPIHVRLLIDTGASGTCVVSGLLAPLGLTPRGQVSIWTPSTGTTAVHCDQYEVSITLLHHGINFIIPTCSLTECQPLGGTIQGLLGRDILAHCLLTYHGQVGWFSLSF